MVAKKKKAGKKRGPRLGRSPVPPPGYFLEKDEYDRTKERQEAEREIEDAEENADEP